MVPFLGVTAQRWLFLRSQGGFPAELYFSYFNLTVITCILFFSDENLQIIEGYRRSETKICTGDRRPLSSLLILLNFKVLTYLPTKEKQKYVNDTKLICHAVHRPTSCFREVIVYKFNNNNYRAT